MDKPTAQTYIERMRIFFNWTNDFPPLSLAKASFVGTEKDEIII